MGRAQTIRQRFILALYVTAVAAVSSPALVTGATRTWEGDTPGNSNWSTSSNWVGNAVPGSGDIALFDGTATGNCVINSNVSVAGITIANTFPGSLTQSSGSTVTVGSTGLSIAGGTFVGSDSTITINGPFAQSGGVFTSTSGNMNILRNFTISGGTFNHNNGTITHTSYDKTMNIGSAVLKNLVIATGGNSLTTTGTVTIAGDLTINSVNYMNGGTMAVAGNVVSNDSNLIGYPGTVILFNGTGNQTWTAGVTGAMVPSVDINKPSGTLTLVGSNNVFNHWTHTAGNVDCGTGTLTFLGYDKTVTPGTMTYGNVTYDSGGNSITTNGTMTVNGTFTLKSVNYMNSGTIAAKGNVVTMDNALIGYPGTIIEFSGTGNQSLSANGGYNLVPSMTINKPSGTLTMTDSIGVFNNFTYTAGTVDASACTVKFVGYDKTITSTAGMVFSNVEVATGGNSVTIAGALKCSGNFTLTSVNYFQAASSGTNGALYVGGNLTSADTSVNSWYGVPIILDGSGDQLLDTAGGTAVFPRNITINKVRCTGGEVKLAGNLRLNQSSQTLTVAEGALNLQGYSLTVSGSGAKFIVEQGGIVKLDTGAIITTPMYYPELRCGSMVIVNGGNTYTYPSNTAAQLSGVGSNTNWTTTGTCVLADTPSSCSTAEKKKVIQWTEVRNRAS
ncbi:MAG: hypothetical protein HZA51_15320 [Planctomycetes bacterium]|nr:hypothetical protein [Planctomycetota bacterium]